MNSLAPDTRQLGPLDPSLFRAQAIAPETLAFNQQLAQLLANVPPLWTVPPAVTRAARAEGRSPLGPLMLSDMARERTIPGPAGEITLRTFVPDTVSGVYLHIHGGGWTLGAVNQQDPALEDMARTLNLAVASVEYRLAPEHPYPAGPDDCEAAALWLAKHAQAEFGSDRLLIGGESAGANLSVVTLLRLRDRHLLRPFQAANLVYGVYDASLTPSARRCPEDMLVLNRTAIEWFYDQYVPAERRRESDVSPLYADLAGLPSALFTVGTLDPLLDDSLFMATRWVAAGNVAELAIYPGGVHGFNLFPYALGRQAKERIYNFLRAA